MVVPIDQAIDLDLAALLIDELGTSRGTTLALALHDRVRPHQVDLLRGVAKQFRLVLELHLVVQQLEFETGVDLDQAIRLGKLSARFIDIVNGTLLQFGLPHHGAVQHLGAALVDLVLGTDQGTHKTIAPVLAIDEGALHDEWAQAEPILVAVGHLAGVKLAALGEDAPVPDIALLVIHLHDANTLASARHGPLAPGRAVIVGLADVVGDGLGDGILPVRPDAQRLGFIQPNHHAEVARVGKVMLTRMRVVEQTIPMYVTARDIRIALAIGRNRELGPAVALDQHVFPDLAKALGKIELVAHIAQRIRTGRGCVLVLRRTWVAFGVGSLRCLVAKQVVALGLNAVDDDIGLAALGQNLQFLRRQLLVVVVVAIALRQLPRLVGGLLGILEVVDQQAQFVVVAGGRVGLGLGLVVGRFLLGADAKSHDVQASSSSKRKPWLISINATDLFSSSVNLPWSLTAPRSATNWRDRGTSR